MGIMNVAGFHKQHGKGPGRTRHATYLTQYYRPRRFNKIEPFFKTIPLVNKRGMAVTEGKPEIEDKTRYEPTMRLKFSQLLKREPRTASRGSASAMWTASRGSANGSCEIYYSVTRDLSSLR
jgi:hypothetical protein